MAVRRSGRNPPLVAALAVLLALLMAVLATATWITLRRGPSTASRSAAVSAPPPLRGTVEGALSGHQVHTYSIALEAGDYLRLVVEQTGVDVVVALLDPSGRQVVEVDRLDGAWGPEELFAIATVSGDHRLRIRPWKGSGLGTYRAEVMEIRAPTALDRERLRAAESFARGAALEDEGGGSGLRRAAPAYEDAMRRWHDVGAPLLEAVSALRLGRVHSKLGEVAVALDHYQRALALLDGSGQPGQEAGALLSTARAYRLSGRPGEALAANRRALEIYRRLDHARGQALALNNLALVHRQTGDIERALDHYEQALEIWRRLDDPEEQATTLHNMGTLYNLLGKEAEALDYLHHALRLRRRAGDRRGEAVTLTAIGWVHYLVGEPRTALPHYREALRLRRAVGDRRGEAATLDRLATALAQLERRPEALAAFRQAEAFLRRAGDRLGLAHTLANLGALHVDWERPERALAYYREALPILRAAGDRTAEAAALTGRARAERASGNLEAARSSLGDAVALIEAGSRTADRLRLRSSFLSSHHGSYELYVDLMMELHGRDPEAGWDAEGFQVAERSRAQGLLAMLQDAHAEIGRTPDPGLLARRRELGERIDRTQRERSSSALQAAPAQRLAALDRELRAQLLELERLRAEIRRRSPRYAALTDPRPPTVEEIQRRLLDGDTALVAFALGEERSFVWLLTRESLVSRPLPPRREIEALARRSHLLLAASHQREARAQARIATATLAEMILGPVADLIVTPRLVVVADGALHYVPFGALPAPGSVGDGERPLLADREIVRVPSLSVLEALRREVTPGPPARGVVAVVADPVFDAGDPRVASQSTETAAAPAPDSGAAELARLVHSRDEARTILDLVAAGEGLAALDFDASRDTVLSGRLDSHRIVHLATHALLDSEHPQLSGLVLSRVDAAGRQRRGVLRAHELYGLELGADLVVLSACRTALGREMRGEGLVGLTGGFMHAGAPRVVVSLWSVSDRATAELMRRFYRGMLDGGLSPAAALRRAQLSLAAEPQWRAPYFWSGFVLLGEWRNLPPPLSPGVEEGRESHFRTPAGTAQGSRDASDQPTTPSGG